MDPQETDPPIRRKPLPRRLAQDLRALLPVLGLGVCFGAATMGIVAVESDSSGAGSIGLASVDAPPPSTAAWRGAGATSAVEAPGLPVPTASEAIAREGAQEAFAPGEARREAAPLSGSASASLASSRSRAARPRR